MELSIVRTRLRGRTGAGVWVVLGTVLAFLATDVAAQQPLVPAGATWQYRKGTAEASSPAAAWRARNYNAAAWSTGPAPFHYGDGLTAGTALPDMQGAYTCVFLRREFTVSNRSEIAAIRLLADYDDGFVAWINGVEIARAGVTGEPLYSSVASSAHEGGSFVAFTPASAPATYLVEGVNVLAVQAFNRNLSTSTDFRIDVALEAERPDSQAPTVASHQPPELDVGALTQVTVVFSEAVTGVRAEDLLVNASGAVQLTGVPGTTTYAFGFPQPAPGLVTIAWSESHRISDLQGNPFNTEDPSSTWTYVLRDTRPPRVIEVTPQPGVTVGRLTQVELIFDEPVVGLDASDLRVNGQGATNVTGSDAGPYRFRFAEPAPGGVAFTWAAGHGITDTAPVANGFSGSAWSLTLNPAAAGAGVVINEFVAANETGLRDEDGEAQDWIELLNLGPAPVELAGWSLTDDPAVPGKWVFPARLLGVGQYLVVFASGKDRRTASGANRLHTNFKLSPFGEYLALSNAELPRTVTAEFTPAFPEQRSDFAYGRNAANQWRYFATPTPGSANSGASLEGVAPEPHFSVERGTFDAAFELWLTTPLAGASLRYTLDGSEPTATTGLLYQQALVITNTTIVRAATFRDGYLPSRTRTHSYLFLDAVMSQSNRPAGFPATWGTWSGFPNNQVPADYEMDLDPLRVDPNNAASPLDPVKVQRLQQGLRELPIVSLVMKRDDMFGANGLYPRASDGNKAPNEKACSIEMLEPDGTTAFVIEGGLDLHGNASRSPLKNPKHGFKLSFRSDYGPTTLRHRLFPDSPVEEFDDLILRSDFNSSWRHWSDSSGNGNGAYQRSRGTRTRFAWSQETFREMGHVAPHTRFFHLFINGLYWGTYDFAEQPTERFAANYYGGTPGEHDIYDQGALKGGTAAAYNAMLGVTGLNTLAGYERMKQYLDIPEFIDYMLLHFYVGHQDWGDNKNWYAIRPRNTGLADTFKYLPWDQECMLLEENVNRVPNGGGGSDVPSGLHTRLDDNTQYRLDFADRVHRHLIAPGGALRPEANIARWQKWQAAMDQAIVAESCRWGDYRRDVHRYSEGTYQLYTREAHWLAENNRLVGSYFVNRGEVVLGQLRAAGLYPDLDPPAFNHEGGRVPRGFALTMTAPVGTVWYTLDGTDPRQYGTGAVAAGTRAYTGPVVLEESAVVKARVLRNGVWSALQEATYQVGELGLPLRFTEIMYRPPGGEAFEFIELQNVGGLPLDLGGFSLRGLDYVFPENSILPARATLVLASGADPAGFAARYAATVVFGHFGGSLDNGGERLAVVDREGRTVTSVHYDDEGGWPEAADGDGYSLEVLDPRGDPSAPANWRASAVTLGTPGVPPPAPGVPKVQFSELMAENLSAVPRGNGFPDWLELYNPTGTAVGLANWSLTDGSDPRAYVFPAGTALPPHGFLVVWCDDDASTPAIHAGFALGRRGETLRLFDANTNLVDAITFGLQVADLSVSRVGDAWQLTPPTPGLPNAAPVALATGTDVTLNEWLAASEPGAADWLELFNRSRTSPARLQGMYLGTSTGLTRIESLSFLAPGGYVGLLADEQPGADHLELKLPAAGDELVLYDATGLTLERVSYGPQRAGVSEGRFPDGTPAVRAFAGSASPGAANRVLAYAGPVLNEVLARNQRAVLAPWGAYADWVELYNPNATAAALDGMALALTGPDDESWVFPAGVMLPGRSHLLLWCDGTRPPSKTAGDGSRLNTGFGLRGNGGELVLLDPAGQPVDGLPFGPQVTDLSVGRVGGGWRLLAAPSPGSSNAPAADLGDVGGVRFNEWMAEPAAGEDWFELYNPGPQPVELSGCYLTDNPSVAGITNTVIGSLSYIGARQWLRWTADGDGQAGPDHTGFRLDGGGETLRLYSGAKALIDAVNFGQQAAGVSEGRLPDGGFEVVRFPGTTSPGSGNYLALTNVVINEVLAHADPPLEDAIELHNPGAVPVAIGGWYLSDDPQDLRRYALPAGTTIPAGGYRVVYLHQFGTPQGEADVPPRFGLNAAHGDAVFLAEVDAGGKLTGRRTGVTFGASLNGVSFGRYATSVGVEFVALSRRTLGQDEPATVEQSRTGTGLPNARPLIGPVVISEIQYGPLVGGDSGNEPALLEFVELLNISNQPVPLFDPEHPENAWRLAGAVSFCFLPGTMLPPRDCLLVVGFDPATDAAALSRFRAIYGAAGLIQGPYVGQLANEGEELELLRPDAPQSPPDPEAGYVPYVLADRVAYEANAPWPVAAEHPGFSIQRLDSTGFGNEPLNWTASTPTAGQAGHEGDGDGDGLPDVWEREHGTDPAVVDAGQDPDADGMSNFEEYVAGTDPRSAASVLALRMSWGPDRVRLEYRAEANRSYTVLQRDTLGTGAWNRLADVPADPVSRTVTVEDPAPIISARYYLLVTPAWEDGD